MIAPFLLFGWHAGGTIPPVATAPRPALSASHLPRRALEASSAVPFLLASRRTSPALPAARLSPLLPACQPVVLRLARSLCNRIFEASSMSITSHLSFFRGEDITLDFQMTPPSDITGWAITLKVADALGGSVLVTKSASIVDGPRGRFRVTLASADTATLAVGRYVWDARRTDSGNRATLADGTLDLRQEVTA
jgi:hypothetical protein